MKDTNIPTHETRTQLSHSKFSDTVSIRIDPELWSRFKGECKLRGAATCHVLAALMEAWIEGQKATATVIKPVVVNLTMEHVVQRPRRMQSFEDLLVNRREKTWPPPCPKADDYIKSTGEVGCLDLKDWVPLNKCWRCFLARERPGFY